MSKEEFESAYAARSKVTVEWLHSIGRWAMPCDCGEPDCEGWQMTSPDRRADIAEREQRTGFTLIEMTIVILVIGILAALAIPVFATALQQSRAHRTRAIVSKIDTIIGEKWEGYRTRQVPVRVSPTLRPDQAAAFRLTAMRELMRFELPDRVSDVANGPAYASVIPSPSGNYPVYSLAALAARPSVNKQFLRYANQAHRPGNPNITGIDEWTTPNENAECLYLILLLTRDGDNKALDWFAPSEIGDVDDDGMKEVLDSWGQPIAFLRWPAGYRSDVAPFPVTSQDGTTPDPFDPFHSDYRWNDATTGNEPFALRPLVWSAGQDKRHGVDVGGGFTYAGTSPPNDPYVNSGVIGQPVSADATDNITNHDLEAR